jgi:hypothetical protein
MIGFFTAGHSGCSLAPEFGNARFELTHAPQSECLGLGNQLVAQAAQVLAAGGKNLALTLELADKPV